MCFLTGLCLVFEKNEAKIIWLEQKKIKESLSGTTSAWTLYWIKKTQRDEHSLKLKATCKNSGTLEQNKKNDLKFDIKQLFLICSEPFNK